MKKILVFVLMASFGTSLAYPPAGTMHDIAVDFQGTFSILDACCNDLNDAITECCATLEQDFAFTWTIFADLDNDNSGVFTALNNINKNFCTPTFIMQDDVGTTGITLSAEGIYKLGENITFTPETAANAITIDADNSILDLQCFALFQGNGTAGVNGIQVDPSRANILIKNGCIHDFTNAGVRAGENADRIKIQDIFFDNNARGILFDGDPDMPILDSCIQNVELRNSVTAIEMINAENSLVKQVLAYKSSRAGIDARQSFTSVFEDLTVKQINSNTNAYGIRLTEGALNTVRNAQIVGVSSSSINTDDVAIGISLGSTETGDKICNNSIDSIITTSLAQAIGIGMNSIIGDVAVPVTSANFTGDQLDQARWSPDGRYLAVGGDRTTSGESQNLYIYEYTEAELVLTVTAFAGIGPVGDQPAAIALSWSPDGRYLAVGTSGGTNGDGERIIIYEFSRNQLIKLTSISAVNPVLGIDWSPSGNYIAVGLLANGTGDIRIVKFNNVDNTLNLVLDVDLATQSVRHLRWSPNGKYLATPSDGFGALDHLRVWAFNGISLVEVAVDQFGDVPVENVAWSPDGQYLAATSNSSASFPEFKVFQFTGSSLNLIASVEGGTSLYGLDWSNDGKYIAVAGFSPFHARVYEFTNKNSLTLISSGLTSFGFRAADWNPNGQVIAFGREGTGGPTTHQVFIQEGLFFPNANQIKGNNVCQVTGPEPTTQTSFGIGLDVSSGDNLIIGNTSYNNNQAYSFVPLERYREFVSNIRLRNEFPNRLSNTEFPPL